MPTDLTEQMKLTKSSIRLCSGLVVTILAITGCQHFAHQRPMYQPPTAQSVIHGNNPVGVDPLSMDSLEVPVIEPNTDLKSSSNLNQSSNNRVLNSSTSAIDSNELPSFRRKPQTPPQQANPQAPSFGNDSSSAARSFVQQGAYTQQSETARSQFAQSGWSQAATTQYATGQAGFAQQHNVQQGIGQPNVTSQLTAFDNASGGTAGANRSSNNQRLIGAPRPILSPYATVRGQSGWVPSNGGGGGLIDNTPSVPNGPLGSAPGYAGTIAPGTMGGQGTIAPGATGYDPSLDVPTMTAPGGYQPRVEVAPLDIYVQEKRTGRVILGGSVNSDLGVAGQLIIDERNFDIRAVPRSWSEFFSGYAFRGAGQSFRIELMPGNQVERYTANWTTPNLFGYMPYSLSVGGYYFTRQYRDWTERRMGGRVGLGYNITKDLSIGTEIRGEQVKISNPRITGVPKLDNVLGKNDLYSVRLSLAHDTRDSAFLATEGGLLQLMYDQAFGSFDYPQGQVNYSRYFRVRERADGMGRHVLATTWKVGVSGTNTPIYENFYAGGFSSMRGFRFRGASPVEGGVQVGGRFMFLGSLEYMFPLTADEMLRAVAFVDYGTVEQEITMKKDNFRVAPGLGLRIAVPILGPAPLAFDFAAPVAKADGDQTQVMSFYMGFTR